MKVSFEGLGEMVATFYNKSAVAGSPCKLSGNGEVAVCAADDRMLGVAINADNEYAAVTLGGVVTMAYTGTKPTVGFVKLVADGTGGVKAGGDDKYCVLSVEDGYVTFIL